MKKFKLIVIFGLIACLSACIFAACGKPSGGTSVPASEESRGGESESAKTEYKDGEYTLLDFETPAELYSVRPYIPDILDIYGSISVVNEEGRARSGSGSLKYSYQSGKKPSLVFYPEHSAYPDIPMEKLASFGVSVYSSAESNQKVTLGIVSGKSVIYEETRELASGWNDYVFELDPVLVKFRSGEIKAFCVSFETGKKPCDYYLDKWTAKVGEKELTEIQKNALSFVEKVNGIQSGTPDPQTLLDAYGYYLKLDDSCRSAVSVYYDKYVKAVKRFFEVKSWNAASGELDVAYLSEDFGVLQLEETKGVSYEFASDVFGAGKGGTTFTFNGFKARGVRKDGREEEVKNDVLKFDVAVTTATIVTDSYDYVSFKIKNDSDKPFTLRFNGSVDVVTVAAGASEEVNLPMSCFVEAGNVMNFTFNYRTGETEPAKVHVSGIRAYTLLREELIASALSGEKLSPSGNASVTSSNDKYNLTIKDSAAKITLKKAFDSVNVAQNVSFSLVSDKSVAVRLYSAAGEVVKEISATPTASVVVLSAKEYNEAAYIKVGGACVLTVSDMLLTRAVDNDYAEIILKNDYVVKAGDVVTANAREAIYFLSSFENMLLYKQNYMKNNASGVYSDLTARAAKISETFRAAVTKVSNGTSNEVEDKLVLDLSAPYSLLKSVKPLSSEELKSIESAKKGRLLKYKYTLFDFENPMATSNFGKETKWFDWSGNVSVENFDGGKKMAIGVQRVMPDGDNNARRIFVSYDFSGASSSLNGYDYVAWRIYNANSQDKTLFFVTYGWGSTVYTCTLRANQWTDVKLTVSDFKNAGNFVIYPTDPGEKFYIDNVYACSVEYVQNLIDNLPAASNVTDDDRKNVSFVRAEYDKLSAFAKKKVDEKKLTAAEKKLAEIPYKVYNMSKPNATDNFTHPTDIPSYLWNGDFSIKTDGTYGKVLAVHTTGTTGAQPVVYLGYNLAGVNLSGYDFVKFSVYNPKDAVLTFAVITRGWGKKYYGCSLAAKSWTEIIVPAKDFASAGYFYFADVIANEELTFLMTDIVAHN